MNKNDPYLEVNYLYQFEIFLLNIKFRKVFNCCIVLFAFVVYLKLIHEYFFHLN